ncbi:hypothetical protein KSS87_021392, partial [Heliosperma pusillum]
MGASPGNGTGGQWLLTEGGLNEELVVGWYSTNRGSMVDIKIRKVMVHFDEDEGDDIVTQASNNVPEALIETTEDTIDAVSPPLPINKPGKKRSPAWDEYLVIPAKDSIDGKQRALCSHCKIANFIANSHYGTKNLN